jgi:hypothetical protein
MSQLPALGAVDPERRRPTYCLNIGARTTTSRLLSVKSVTWKIEKPTATRPASFPAGTHR